MHVVFAMILASAVTCGTPADRKGIAAAVKRSVPRAGAVYQTTLAGNYADAGVSADNGNASLSVLLAKRNGVWTVLAHDGGAYDTSLMVKYGIPASAAAALTNAIRKSACPTTG